MSNKEENTTVAAAVLHEVKASDMTLMGSLDKIVTTLISRDTTGATHLQEQKLPGEDGLRRSDLLLRLILCNFHKILHTIRESI